jgi:hypothetical protein
LQRGNETQLHQGPSVRWKTELLAAGLTLAGLCGALALGWASDGIFHGDDISHYDMAYGSWDDPHLLLHFWARPGYNIPTMFVARWFQMPGCRVFSSLLTTLVAYMSFRIARRIWPDRWETALAPLLVWLQPETMTLAITTLTETPAAVYMSMGAWLWLRGNPVWACGFWSPMFLTRVETMGLAPLLAGLCIHDAIRRQGRWSKALKAPWLWAAAGVALWAPVAYIVAAWAVNLPADLHLFNIFGRNYTNIYGQGSWGHYLVVWPIGVGIGVFVLVCAGTMRVRGRGWGIALLLWGLFLLQTVIYRYGWFASGGYGRFMVTVAALAGAMAAGGVGFLLRQSPRAVSVGAWVLALGMAAGAVLAFPVVPAWVAYALIALLCIGAVGLTILKGPVGRKRAGKIALGGVCVVIALHAAIRIRPLPLEPDAYHEAAREVFLDLREQGLDENPMLTSYSVVSMWRSRPPMFYQSLLDDGDTYLGARQDWRTAQEGTVFLFENRPRHRRQGLQYEKLLGDLARYGREVARAGAGRAWSAAWVRNGQEAPPVSGEAPDSEGIVPESTRQ